jgi:hypothetical protein
MVCDTLVHAVAMKAKAAISGLYVRNRIVLAMAFDQGLVVLTEVDAKPRAHLRTSSLGEQRFAKRGCHASAAKGSRILDPQRQSVPAERIAVPNR